jgi:hypothetical protein
MPVVLLETLAMVKEVESLETEMEVDMFDNVDSAGRRGKI